MILKHFGWIWLILLMRFWQNRFLKGQTTSDETVLKIFITKQILLHNFALPVFFDQTFFHILFFHAYFLKHFGWFGRFCWCDFGRTDFWRVKRRQMRLSWKFSLLNRYFSFMLLFNHLWIQYVHVLAVLDVVVPDCRLFTHTRGNGNVSMVVLLSFALPRWQEDTVCVFLEPLTMIRWVVVLAKAIAFRFVSFTVIVLASTCNSLCGIGDALS